jgi:acyl dehydratase
MSHRTFADVTVDETIDCGTNSVTREEIITFGEQFDPLAIHTDPEGAADSPFDDVIASGFHTLALTQPPAVKHFFGNSDLVASGHMEELRLPAPVYPGDTLAVTLTPEAKRDSERNDRRGVVTTRREATVDGETVLSLLNHTIWER